MNTSRAVHGTVILMLMLATHSIMQSQPKPAPDTDTTITFRAPVVVVQATRTPELNLSVPMAVSTVPARTYEQSRGYELKDALESIPGVFSQSRAGSADLRITIRGFGARGAGNRSNAGNMRGIRVLIDGIPETEPDGRTSLDLVDLNTTSGVEVLRSNASTLYGNASGGVIGLYSDLSFPHSFVEVKNVIGTGGTSDPTTLPFGFVPDESRRNVLSRTTLRAGIISGTSTHILLTGTNSNFSGFRDHGGSSELVLNAAIRSELSEGNVLSVYAGASSNLFRFPGALTRSQMDADPFRADSQFVVRDERRFNRIGRFATTLEQTIASGHSLSTSLFLQPKVIERSERNSYRDFNRYTIGGQTRYRWQTKIGEDIESGFTAGVDESYQDGTVVFYNLVNGTRGTTVLQNKQEAANAFGGYAEEALQFGSIGIRFGGRYDAIAYTYRDFTNPVYNTVPQKLTFTQFTPKAGITWMVTSSHAVYGSFGGGAESPAFNEVDPPSDSLILARGGTIDTNNNAFNPLLKPATSTSFELGAKGLVEFESGAISFLTYDAAVYLISISNDLIPWNGGAFYFTAGKTRRMGAELSVATTTTFGLSARLMLTLCDNKYVEYENQLGKFDGNAMAGLPSMYGGWKLRYKTPIDITLELNSEFVGSYYADDRNDKLVDGTPDATTKSFADAYSIYNMSAGWEGNIGSLRLGVFAELRNLADARYVSSVYINGESNKYFEPGMPRNVVIGVKLRNIFR